MLKGLDSGKKVSKALSFFILVAVSVLMIIPLVWGVAGSFRTSNDVLANPEKFFPSDWDAFTFDGYKELFSKAEFNSTTPNEWYPIWNWLFNSLIVALGGTLLYLVIAALAAYAFVFLDFNEPVPLFYIDHIAMMGTFIWLAYYASVLIRSKNDKSDGGLLASVQKGERENDRYE